MAEKKVVDGYIVDDENNDEIQETSEDADEDAEEDADEDVAGREIPEEEMEIAAEGEEVSYPQTKPYKSTQR